MSWNMIRYNRHCFANTFVHSIIITWKKSSTGTSISLSLAAAADWTSFWRYCSMCSSTVRGDSSQEFQSRSFYGHNQLKIAISFEVEKISDVYLSRRPATLDPTLVNNADHLQHFGIVRMRVPAFARETAKRPLENGQHDNNDGFQAPTEMGEYHFQNGLAPFRTIYECVLVSSFECFRNARNVFFFGRRGATKSGREKQTNLSYLLNF